MLHLNQKLKSGTYTHKTKTPELYLFITLILIIFTTGLTACDDPLSEDTGREVATLLVANEGNFSDGNGSITSFSPQSGELVQERFQQVNGRPLAGIIQSITVHDDRLYIVSNNINKIEVTHVETLESIATIEMESDFAPAGFAVSPDGKGYVSHLNDGAVYVVDMEQFRVSDNRIATGQNPQEMRILDNRLYVVNNGFGYDNTITVIDTEHDQVADTWEVGAGPVTLKEDSENRLWVVSNGRKAYDEEWNRDPENDVNGRIDVWDAANSELLSTIETGGFPRAIALDETDARAWVVNEEAVQRIDMNSYALVEEAVIPRGFNGIGFSEVENLFYLAYSAGYTQSGRAIMYDRQGMVVDSFSTGIAPVDFHFMVD